MQIGPVEIFFHAEQRRELIHDSAELQWALSVRPAQQAGLISVVGQWLQKV